MEAARLWAVSSGWDGPFQHEEVLVAAGTAVAHASNGHVVQVLATELPPNQWLYYQFSALGEVSRIGRTRTVEPSQDRQIVECLMDN